MIFKRMAGLGLVAMTVGMFSCSSDSAGITVDLGFVHHKTPVSGNIDTSEGAGVDRTFNNGSEDIVLQKGYIAFESIALHECHSDRIVRILSNAIFPVAMAHGDGDPLTATTEQVVSLLGEDLERVSMGEATPPAGDYCGAVITINAADDSTHELPLDVDMVGKSVYLSGTHDAVDFTISSAEEGEVEIDFTQTLTLDGSSTGTKVAIGMVYDTWLNDVNFADSTSTQAAKAMDNILASFEHYTGSYTESEEHAH